MFVLRALPPGSTTTTTMRSRRQRSPIRAARRALSLKLPKSPPPKIHACLRHLWRAAGAAAIDLALHHGGQLRKQLELRRAFKDGDEAADLERLDPGDAFDLREAVRS